MSSLVTSSPERERSNASNRPGWSCRRMGRPSFRSSLVRRSNSKTAKRTLLAALVAGVDSVPPVSGTHPEVGGTESSTRNHGGKPLPRCEQNLFRLLELWEEGLRRVGALTATGCRGAVSGTG